jgi:multiple sugar transport system substrate-binding protein
VGARDATATDFEKGGSLETRACRIGSITEQPELLEKERTMKERPRLAAIVALCIVLIAGTGWASGQSDAAASTQKTIDFMCNGGATNQEMFKEWIADFESKNPDMKVNYFPFPEGGWAKVMTMFAGGTATDITRVNDDDVYDLAKLGQLVHLDPLIDQYLDRDDFYKSAFDALAVEGKVYSVNVGFGPQVFHYNTEMTDNAGLNIPTDWDNTWGWNEFVDTIRKLTVDKDSDGRPEVYGAAWPANIITTFLYSNGTDPLPDGVNVADFVQPKIVSIMQEFSDLSAKYHYAAYIEEDRRVLFNSDKLAFLWDGEAATKEFRPELKWDVAPSPKAKVKAYSVSYVRCFGIPTSSKKIEDAFRFYQYLWSEDGQRISVEYGFGVPARRSAAESVYNINPVPEHRSVYPNELDHDAPLRKDPMSAVWKKYGARRMGEDLINGNMTAQEFLEFIQAEMEKRIEELKKGQ